MQNKFERLEKYPFGAVMYIISKSKNITIVSRDSVLVFNVLSLKILIIQNASE